MSIAVAEAAPTRGIVLLLLANLLFAGMDAVSKTLIVDYPIGQILWVRYAFFAAVTRRMPRHSRE